MKKTLITIYILFFAFVTQGVAQTTRGNFALGGGVLFSSEKDEVNPDYKSTSLAFQPSVGFFVADNFSVGLNLGISSDKTEGTGSFDTKNTSTSIGAFARYYKFTSVENFAFFLQGGFDIVAGKDEVTSGSVTTESKNGSLIISVAPGVSYFFNDHWSLELGFYGFIFESYDPDKDISKDKQTSITLGLHSFMPSSIGIRYYFGN